MLNQLTKLENGYAEIKDLDSRLLESIVKGGTGQKDLQNAINDTEKHSDELVVIRRIVSHILCDRDTIAPETTPPNLTTNGRVHKEYKLPKLNIPV